MCLYARGEPALVPLYQSGYSTRLGTGAVVGTGFKPKPTHPSIVHMLYDFSELTYTVHPCPLLTADRLCKFLPTPVQDGGGAGGACH